MMLGGLLRVHEFIVWLVFCSDFASKSLGSRHLTNKSCDEQMPSSVRLDVYALVVVLFLVVQIMTVCEKKTSMLGHDSVGGAEPPAAVGGSLARNPKKSKAGWRPAWQPGVG